MATIDNMTVSSTFATAVIFSTSVSRKLSTNEVRLPPNYVGVRRVRPSCCTVQTVMKGVPRVHKSLKRDEGVVFKVIDKDTGKERRMNGKEKKALRRKLRNEKNQELKEKKKEQMLARQQVELEKRQNEEASKRKRKTSLTEITSTLETLQNSGDSSRYLPFNVNPVALEEEIADLRGERDGVPPVALAPSLARLLPGSGATPLLTCVMDDDLAKNWAMALKDSMTAAEQVRRDEDMRPMVYDMIPEVWQRMRPESLGANRSLTPQCSPLDHSNDPPSWLPFTFRSQASPTDIPMAAVTQVIHTCTDIHISCGSKFGCDYLMYNAPRDKIHAFAGLRILSVSDGEFPIPTSYDLTGYVRCLNTAAKLALLAMVKETKEPNGSTVHRVAIVELPLIKILSTATRSRDSSNDP